MDRSIHPGTKPGFLTAETNQRLLEILFMITLMFMFENITALADIHDNPRSQALAMFCVLLSISSMVKFGLLVSNGRQELAVLKEARESGEVLVVENSTRRTQRHQSHRAQPAQEELVENWPEVAKTVIRGCDSMKEIDADTMAYFLIQCIIVPSNLIKTYVPIVLGALIKGMKYGSNQLGKGLKKIYHHLKPSLVRICKLGKETDSIPFCTMILSNFLDETGGFVDSGGPTGASRPEQESTGTAAAASSSPRQHHNARNVGSTGRRKHHLPRLTGITHLHGRSSNI